MKICFCIGTLSYSGAEKIMFHLIKEIEKKGNEVSVILMSSDAEAKGLNGITQYPIYGAYKNLNNRVSKLFVNHKMVRRIVRQNHFDILISFGVIFNVDLSEALIGEHTKLIVCERNDPVNDPHSKLLRIRRKIAYNRADSYVFQTDEIKGFFSKRIQEKSFVIPNFIEKEIEKNDRYHPTRNAIATSARLDDRQKDQSTMIRAFKEFSLTHDDYVLEFYGDGPDREKLQDLAKNLEIADKVLFWGRVNNPMERIRTAKMFVLSSVYEGMPNSLIEAMAYGMPCISSDCSGGGARALIVNGENGILFSVGDTKALTNAMSRIVEDESYANKLSENAVNINDTLKMDYIINLWEDAIQKTTGRVK